MRPTFICASLLLALAACDGTNMPTQAIPVHDVSITVTAPGRCLVGGCDPFSGDATTLGLIRILNTGTTTAYLQACGTYPALGQQQLVNGRWVNVGPAIACVYTPGPIALAAGDSVQVNMFFGAGTRRLELAVAGRADMSDEAVATSASFAIQ